MRGFVNEGTVCYFNTAIQCLFNIPILTKHFLREPYDGNCMFTTIYQLLLKKYWTADKTHFALVYRLYIILFPAHHAAHSSENGGILFETQIVTH